MIVESRCWKKILDSIAVILIVSTIMLVGCTTENRKTDQTKASASVVNEQVGKVVSESAGSESRFYRFKNKKIKSYRSLNSFGTKGGIYSDSLMYRDTVWIDKVYHTEKGTFYHLRLLENVGFNKSYVANKSAAYLEDTEAGYVKSTDVKQFKPIKKSKVLKQQKYYLANPGPHSAYNYPQGTATYTYVVKRLDRYTTSQLYATKEIIKHNGSHYLYLKTAKHNIGWVYRGKNLLKGKYRDPGRQLLKPKSGERLVKHTQSLKSTVNKQSVESLENPQKVYQLYGKSGQLKKILVMTVDNRPVRIDFKNGQEKQIFVYSYRRKLLESTTSKKALSKTYQPDDKISTEVSLVIASYPHSKTKRLIVSVAGGDGGGDATVYRNGKVKFTTTKEKYDSDDD